VFSFLYRKCISQWGSPLLLLYYTTFCGVCQEVFEKFFKNFLQLRSDFTPRVTFSVQMAVLFAVAPLDYDNIIPYPTAFVNRKTQIHL
jgi:hypothetical protein